MAESLSHKFGQIIGDLLESALLPHFEKFARENRLYLDKKGIRQARKGKKVTWTDEKGNSHDLDFVLENGGTENKIGVPVAFIESAWRRGTRHSKNKVQEIQAAINPIVLKHKTTVCFKGAILGGDFTHPSLKQLESDNFSVLYFPTEIFEKAFKKFHLNIISDDATTEEEFRKRIEIWEKFGQKNQLLDELLELKTLAVNEFFGALRLAVSRHIEQILILPLYGKPSTVNNATEAINYFNKYSEDKSGLPLIKFEIIVRYNTGDKIEATFRNKKDAINFLELYI